MGSSQEAHDLYCWGFGGLGQLGSRRSAWGPAVPCAQAARIRGHALGELRTTHLRRERRPARRSWGRRGRPAGRSAEECVESPAGVAALGVSAALLPRREAGVGAGDLCGRHARGAALAAAHDARRATRLHHGPQPRGAARPRHRSGGGGGGGSHSTEAKPGVGGGRARELPRRPQAEGEAGEDVAQSHLQLPPSACPSSSRAAGCTPRWSRSTGSCTWGHSGHGQTGQSAGADRDAAAATVDCVGGPSCEGRRHARPTYYAR